MIWTSERLLQAVAQASPEECITEVRMAEITGLDAIQVDRAAFKLRKHGLLEKTGQGCHMLTEAGREAAAAGKTLRSGPVGRHTGHRASQPSLRMRAWRAMRIRRKFSIPDLCILVAQGGERDIESNLGKYIRALVKAGYLVELPRRERGTALTSNGYKRWWLIDTMNTGPQAPVWRVAAGEIYDPNTEQTVRLREVRHVV